MTADARFRYGAPYGAALLCVLLAHAPCAAQPQGARADALQKVTLQLKWKHQFQFAGYYAAAEKGFYRDAGFEVRLKEAEGADTIDEVLAGRADYGVATSELAQRRASGAPVVALATILQHSALALAVRGGTALTVHDLAGRRVMVTPHDAELFAYLKREGLPEDRVVRVPMSYRLEDLIRGKVDAFSIYTTDQVWLLRKARLAHSVLSPRAAGIDFYGDTLFTSESLVARDRARAAAFRDATLRGWEYAMRYTEEVIDLIVGKYGRRLSREHLLYEAGEMRRLMQPELIEIGHMNPGRWQQIAEVYADLGMVPRNPSLKGLLFDEAPERAKRLPPAAWAWAALAALLALTLGLWVARLRRELRRALEMKDAAEARLRQAAGSG